MLVFCLKRNQNGNYMGMRQYIQKHRAATINDHNMKEKISVEQRLENRIKIFSKTYLPLSF